jgi:hypothetical protein
MPKFNEASTQNTFVEQCIVIVLHLVTNRAQSDIRAAKITVATLSNT